MFGEFKKFLIKGNMMDMAVGFIFGAAFSTLIKSFVADIIMPPIGMIIGDVNFSELFISLDGKHYATIDALEKAGAPAIKYGLFINQLISFLILGIVAFFLVKVYNSINPEPAPEPTTKTCGDCAMEIPVAAKKCPYCGNSNI
jgi:large conductance mechanosensitive channel